MKYEVFVEKVKNALESYMGDRACINVVNVPKNNGIVLTGVSLRYHDCNLAPTFYLEHFYMLYKEGQSFGEVMKVLIDEIEKHQVSDVDFDYFDCYDNVKENLFCKLINQERNRDYLEVAPYIPWNDLAITFYYSIAHPQLGFGLIQIKNEHLELWGVDLDRLYQDAYQNTVDKLKERTFSLFELIENMMEETRMSGRDATDAQVYVLTNIQKNYGAFAMLYSNTLRQMAKRIQHNLFLIPSSVHEIIVFPDDGSNSGKGIREIIKQVNQTQVPEEEILSDELYYYDWKNDAILVYEEKN